MAKGKEIGLQRQIERLTCEGCPTRTASRTVQRRSLDLFKLLEGGCATLDDVMNAAHDSFEFGGEAHTTNLGECAGNMLADYCDTYIANPQDGTQFIARSDLQSENLRGLQGHLQSDMRQAGLL